MKQISHWRSTSIQKNLELPLGSLYMHHRTNAMICPYSVFYTRFHHNQIQWPVVSINSLSLIHGDAYAGILPSGYYSAMVYIIYEI